MKFDVEGLAPFINRLEKFDKDVSKELKAEMKKGADVVAKAAGSTVSGVPISGWGTWNHQGRDLGYNPSKVKSGFKVATNRYRRRGVTAAFGYDVVQANAGGSVYEVIGDKSRVTGPQGELLARASVGERELLIADVDLARSESVRRIWPFLRDRRIDAYADLLKRYRD